MCSSPGCSSRGSCHPPGGHLSRRSVVPSGQRPSESAAESQTARAAACWLRKAGSWAHPARICSALPGSCPCPLALLGNPPDLRGGFLHPAPSPLWAPRMPLLGGRWGPRGQPALEADGRQPRPSGAVPVPQWVVAVGPGLPRCAQLGSAQPPAAPPVLAPRPLPQPVLTQHGRSCVDTADLLWERVCLDTARPPGLRGTRGWGCALGVFNMHAKRVFFFRPSICNIHFKTGNFCTTLQ